MSLRSQRDTLNRPAITPCVAIGARARSDKPIQLTACVAAILVAITPAYGQFPAEDVEPYRPPVGVGPIDTPLTPVPREIVEPEPEIVRFTGRIVRLEGNELTLETNDTNENLTHTIAADAEVVLNQEPAELRDLRPGDFVRIRVVAGGNPQVSLVWAAREQEHADQPDKTYPPAAFRETPEERRAATAEPLPQPVQPQQGRQSGRYGQYPPHQPGYVYGSGLVGGPAAARQAGGLGVVVTNASGNFGLRGADAGDEYRAYSQFLAGDADAFRDEFGANANRQTDTTDTLGVASDIGTGGESLGVFDDATGTRGPIDGVDDTSAFQQGAFNQSGGGALVLEVRPGTPADQVGLRRGDVILELGNQRINSGVELVQRIVQIPPGTAVMLTVQLGDEQQPSPDPRDGDHPNGDNGDAPDNGDEQPDNGGQSDNGETPEDAAAAGRLLPRSPRQPAFDGSQNPGVQPGIAPNSRRGRAMQQQQRRSGIQPRRSGAGTTTRSGVDAAAQQLPARQRLSPTGQQQAPAGTGAYGAGSRLPAQGATATPRPAGAFGQTTTPAGNSAGDENGANRQANRRAGNAFPPRGAVNGQGAGDTGSFEDVQTVSVTLTTQRLANDVAVPRRNSFDQRFDRGSEQFRGRRDRNRFVGPGGRSARTARQFGPGADGAANRYAAGAGVQPGTAGYRGYGRNDDTATAGETSGDNRTDQQMRERLRQLRREVRALRQELDRRRGRQMPQGGQGANRRPGSAAVPGASARGGSLAPGTAAPSGPAGGRAGFGTGGGTAAGTAPGQVAPRSGASPQR